MWDFGDGTNAATNDGTTTHTYQQPGNFTVTLKVQDNTGEKVVQTYAITVTPKGNDILEYLKIVIPLIAASIGARSHILHL